jgi:hypothetical protein
VTITAAAGGCPAPTVQWQVSSDGGKTFSNIAGATSATLTFTATLSAGGYEYRAVFSNALGQATTGAATLTLLVPPAVVANPSNRAVIAGQKVTFTAAASGSPSPAAQWQVSTDGGKTFSNLASATSPTLTFTATAGQNGDEYRAVFTSSAGTATTSAATLTVNYAPTVTAQPASLTAVAGSLVTFSAAASGNPPPVVQWQVSTDGGKTFSNVAGATANSLTLTASLSAVGREYRAVFRNALGTAITQPAALTVVAPPVVTANPVGRTVSAGQKVTFTAAGSGNPVPAVQWQVSTDGGNTFSDIAGANTATLSFTAGVAQNGSEYRAVFTNVLGTTTTRAASLTVNFAPAITTQPASQVVVAGGRVTFAAAASANPTPAVQWQVSTDGGRSFRNVAGATSAALSLTAAAAQNGNQYRAVFTNALGTAVTTTATLDVDFAPTVIAQPSSRAAVAGQMVTLTAAAVSNPAPTVQWQVSTNGGQAFSDIAGATAITLTLTAAAGDNGNQYRAVFTNALGTAATSAATLVVKFAPTIITEPLSQTVAVGSLVSFTAAAGGNPAPAVQWQVSGNGGLTFSNIAGATSATLTLTASQTANGRKYRAVFTNGVGTAVSAAATLTVDTAPVVTP